MAVPHFVAGSHRVNMLYWSVGINFIANLFIRLKRFRVLQCFITNSDLSLFVIRTSDQIKKHK